MNHCVNIFSNHDEASLSIRKQTIEKLTQHGIETSESYRDDATLNICIGGDGSFLRAVHKSNYSSIPFVGINTGHLGFYQEILCSEIDLFIENYLSNQYIQTSLNLIQGNIEATNRTHSLQALNEIVVKSDNSSIVHLDVYVDGFHLERFAGDGLIVSTPSGSTAYNFSVGGSILYQTLSGFQMSPIAPINSKAYRSLMNSIVMPNNTILEFVPIGRNLDNLIVIADGQSIQYKQLEKITFTISDLSIVKLVFNPDWYWFNIKDKFL